MRAHYSTEIPLDDGGLRAVAWRKAEAYPLWLPRDAGTGLPVEGGEVRFAWNEQYLFAGFRFVDSDVMSDATQDQERLWELGDVAELFVGPLLKPYYWESHASPNGRRLALFLPGPGRRGLPSTMRNPYLDTLVTSVEVRGRLNDWRTRDEGWSALMAVPASTLSALGDPYGEGSRWRVLAARYNYSCFLPGLELSSSPQLSRTCFHMPEEFAELELRR